MHHWEFFLKKKQAEQPPYIYYSVKTKRRMFCVSTIFDHGVIVGATMKEILYYSFFFKSTESSVGGIILLLNHSRMQADQEKCTCN